MTMTGVRGPERFSRGLAVLIGLGFSLISAFSFAASEVGGNPEKKEIVIAYPQPSGAFAPLWVAYEAGLFKKYGLSAKLQVLNPQVLVQAVVSGSADVGAAGADMVSAALQGARIKIFAGTTLKFLKDNPNTVYAFLQAIAEGVAISRNDAAAVKRATVKYAKIEDPKTVDETYDAFASHWATSLAVRSEPIQVWFSYLDEKEFPQAKNADSRAFYDNSFVDNLEKAGFFQNIGWVR